MSARTDFLTATILILMLSACGHRAGYPGDGADQLWKTIPYIEQHQQ